MRRFGGACSLTPVPLAAIDPDFSGELRSRLGTYLLAAGAAGEFGPILLLTLILSTQSAVHNAVILIVFVLLAVGVALLAVRSSSPALRLFEQTIEKSSQLAVRWILVLVFALAVLAYELGLDLLLGGFAAGLITRQLLQEREVPGFDSKLTAVAFGVFVPFFFVVSGMELDVAALFSTPIAIVKMVLFFGIFLVVRGTPALLLYRDILDRRARMALALFTSTQLPLVLAITTVARETGNMHATTAASLVCATVLSTLVFPMLGLKLRAGRPAERPGPARDRDRLARPTTPPQPPAAPLPRAPQALRRGRDHRRPRTRRILLGGRHA